MSSIEIREKWQRNISQVAALVASGSTKKAACEKLGINKQSLNAWELRFRKENGGVQVIDYSKVKTPAAVEKINAQSPALFTAEQVATLLRAVMQ